MRKGTNYNKFGTNIDALGSSLEQATRKEAAELEEAWHNAGKEVGIQVWRIEKFKVAEWPEDQKGKFYSGDSYICLNTYNKIDRLGGKGAIAWDIHFWIGSKSSQDEYGTAAYKTVELDDYLGQRPVQYRETQGHESERFLKMFKRLEIMEGGIASGFRKVGPKTYRSRLLHIKGKMNVISREVPMDWKSLNSGDIFVLDKGLNLYVFQGSKCGVMEKQKGASIVQAIDDERGGKPEKHYFNEFDADVGTWWEALGSKPARGQKIKSAEEGGSDHKVKVNEKRLFRLSDEKDIDGDGKGDMQMTLMAEGKALNRNLLDSRDVFILDQGYEITVWVGKGASYDERRMWMQYVDRYIEEYGRPKQISVNRMLEGGENETFEEAFEVGVMSTKGRNAKGGKNFKNIKNLQTTKGAAQSVLGTLGQTGPGVGKDMDDFYRQEGVDPADWKGRKVAESDYAKELQKKQKFAYNRDNGWVSAATKEERDERQRRRDQIEQQYEDGSMSSTDPHAYTDAKYGYKKSSESTIGNQDYDQGSMVSRSTYGMSRAQKANMDPKMNMDRGIQDYAATQIQSKFRGMQARKNLKNSSTPVPLRQSEPKSHGGRNASLLSGTIVPVESDPKSDAQAIRDALTAGMFADKDTLINILCRRNMNQRQLIRLSYITDLGSDLEQDIHENIGMQNKNLRTLLEALIRDPYEQAAYCLNKAMRGMGCDECALIEVLCTREAQEIAKIKELYNKEYKRDLEKDIIDECAGNFEELMVRLVQGTRAPHDAPIDENQCRADAKRLYNAGEKKFGTDKKVFNEILADRSLPQLLSIFQYYKSSALSKNDIARAIQKEYNFPGLGDLRRGLLTIVEVARDPAKYFAEMLAESMAGLGADDNRLIRIIISRCEVDMAQIKEKFLDITGKSLVERIKSETSGYEEKALIALIGESESRV